MSHNIMDKIIEAYLEYLNDCPLCPIISCITYKDKKHYYHDVDKGLLFSDEELIKVVIEKDEDFMKHYGKGE